MRAPVFAATAAFCMCGASVLHGTAPTAEPTPTHLTSFVDLFIGTRAQGNTFPGAAVPFGMEQLSPTPAPSAATTTTSRASAPSARCISPVWAAEQAATFPRCPPPGPIDSTENAR